MIDAQELLAVVHARDYLWDKLSIKVSHNVPARFKFVKTYWSSKLFQCNLSSKLSQLSCHHKVKISDENKRFNESEYKLSDGASITKDDYIKLMKFSNRLISMYRKSQTPKLIREADVLEVKWNKLENIETAMKARNKKRTLSISDYAWEKRLKKMKMDEKENIAYLHKAPGKYDFCQSIEWCVPDHRCFDHYNSFSQIQISETKDAEGYVGKIEQRFEVQTFLPYAHVVDENNITALQSMIKTLRDNQYFVHVKHLIKTRIVFIIIADIGVNLQEFFNYLKNGSGTFASERSYYIGDFFESCVDIMSSDF